MGNKVLKKKQPVNNFISVGESQQVHEKIVVQIKKAIFERKIKPGERLPSERELAEIFNTSRVTVRSAILTLKNSGLVCVKKGTGGGTFVADDLGETEISGILRNIIRWKNISIRHVIEVRGIIEPQIAYMAATDPMPHEIEDIWDTISELEQSFKTKTRFQGEDENFHKALAVAAKNPLLMVFQASLIDLLFKFISSIRWNEEDKRDMIIYHKEIAEKVEQKDPKGARKAMLEHLSDMRRILSRYPMKDVLE